MKKITLLLILMMCSLGFAQDLKLGFETGESGGVNGAPFGGMPVPVVETGTGSNTSQVLKIVGSGGPEVWQGINLNLTSQVQLTTTKSMTMDVLSSTPITFLVKVNGGLNGAPEAAAEVTHNGDGTWQTITFTFNTALDGKAATANGIYASFVIHAYWTAGNTTFDGVPTPARTFYVDNIKGPSAPVNTCLNGIQDGDETGVDCGGSCAPCPSPPTTAAPTPPNRNASDVISLYSGSYTNVPSNFDAGWCGINSVQEVSIGGNPTMAWKGNNCQGIDLNTGINATSFTNLHVDVYIQAGTDLTSSVFNLKFVQQPGGGALEINFNVASTPALVAGSWLQIDVPVNLSTFTNFKEFGITSNLNNKLWYDNLYVYKGTPLGTASFEKSNIKMYPNPVKNTLTIEANASINKVSVYNVLGQEVLTASPKNNSATLQTGDLQRGVYMVTTDIDGNISSSKFVKE